jgi:hypothetical protein
MSQVGVKLRTGLGLAAGEVYFTYLIQLTSRTSCHSLTILLKSPTMPSNRSVRKGRSSLYVWRDGLLIRDMRRK